MINIYNSKTTDFTNNGIVVLSDTISCKTTEELNGAYELTLEYPLDERGKWQNLLEGNIVKADGQLFRIYHKSKNLTSIKVNARHIFYDLLDNFLEDVRPTNLSGQGALNWVLTHTQYPHSFISMGDVGGTNTKYFIRKNPVEAIMGTDGIISSWGGELVRDNFTIKLLGARGIDRGVLIAYGKNIKGIEETLDRDGICTRLMPIGKDGLLLTEKYVDSPYINNFEHPKIRSVEFAECEDQAALRTAATKYMLDNKIDIPPFNYKIDFLELTKTEEYKNYSVLESVYIGDTVTIKHSKLNINLKAKVIKVTKNNLTNKIEGIELGNFKSNISAISTSIQNIKKDITQVKSDYQIAIDNATSLITGAKGGNVVIRLDANKKPYEILIMDTTDVNTARKVWRWNIGGLGYSSSGINGPFGIAMTSDGKIVADFITTGSLSAGIIKAGILTSNDGSCSINLETGEIHFKKGLIEGLNSSWDLNTGIFKSTGSFIGTNYDMLIGNGQIKTNGVFRISNTPPVGRETIMLFSHDTVSKASLSIYTDEVDLSADTKVTGSFRCTGDKQCLQTTTNYGQVPFYANEDFNSLLTKTPIEETFETMFYEDTGKYKSIIKIDEITRECINTDIDYIVWLTKSGQGDLWVVNTYPGYFVVESDRVVRFRYKLEGRRKNFEDRTIYTYLKKFYKEI